MDNKLHMQSQCVCRSDESLHSDAPIDSKSFQKHPYSSVKVSTKTNDNALFTDHLPNISCFSSSVDSKADRNKEQAHIFYFKHTVPVRGHLRFT